MKASDIIESVEATLLDPQNEFWPSNELLGYANDAQRQIVNLKPDANARDTQQALIAGIQQAMPVHSMRLIDVPRNIAGPAITAVDRRDLDRMVPNWTLQGSADVIEHYMYDDRYPETFAVYPPASAAAKVEIVYSATLTDINSTGATLDLPDQYRAAIIEYVLYRAHSKDSEAAVPQRAQAHYQQFVSMLGMQRQASAMTTAGEPDQTRELR